MFGLLRVFNATRNLLTGTIPRTFGAAGIFTLVRRNVLGTRAAAVCLVEVPLQHAVVIAS